MSVYGKMINASPAYILKKDMTPGDVARAMIEDGHQKQPFHVFDMDEAYRRIQNFKRSMPRIDIFYGMNKRFFLRFLLKESKPRMIISCNNFYNLSKGFFYKSVFYELVLTGNIIFYIKYLLSTFVLLGVEF